jgi:hypothetical protein
MNAVGCKGWRIAIAVASVVVASVQAGCGGDSGATSPAAAPTTIARSGAPTGDPAPMELQGTWKLVSDNPDHGLLFVISDTHYRVPTRFAHGDLVVDGDEIAFFNAAICGLQLPDGVGRYRWSVHGRQLHLEPVDEDPCGGRSDILENATYRRVG